MATSTSWTLWKRLPPRYQLSLRTFVDENEFERFSPPSSPKPQRRGSPRQQRVENKSARPPHTSPTPGMKRSIQNFPDVPETNHPDERSRPSSPSGSFFPFRKSGYIDHFKTQQRVNSARVMMATESTSRSPSPTGRLNKTSQQPEMNTDGVVGYTSANSRSTATQQTAKRCEHQRGSIHTDINNDAHSQHSNKMEQRKYLVRETNEGTMYIDRGKIIYFRSYKQSPVSQASYMSRCNDGGYLASIRREYLTKPRLLAMGPQHKTIKNEINVHEERANYNRKVAHILDYYSYPDEDNISVDDLTKYTSHGRRLNSPRRQANLSSRNVKRIYFSYPKSDHESRFSSSPMQDLQNDPGSFFKVNQQSKLHDRNFYLKTPSHKSSFHEADILDCTCGICRIEMQLALMTQAEAENELKSLQAKLPKPKNPQVKNITIVQNKQSKANSELKLDLNMGSTASDKKDLKDVSVPPKPTPVEDNQQEQILTVTIPKMDTNREITEVAKENEVILENLPVIE